MSTQFDQVFDGLSKKSLSLEDACRVLYSELQASPESMRVCCERIETELSRGRITSDAAQLLLDALGEHGMDSAEAQAEEVWVDVPLEPVAAEAPRPAPATKSGTESITEVDLTMDDLLAALDRRGTLPAKVVAEVDFDVGDELAAPVEWVEWEPELSGAAATASAEPTSPSSIAAPAAEEAWVSAPAAAPVAALQEPDAAIEVELADAVTPELYDAAVSAELEMAAAVGQPEQQTPPAGTVEQATPAEATSSEAISIEAAIEPPPALAVESFDDAFAEIEAAAQEIAAPQHEAPSEVAAEPAPLPPPEDLPTEDSAPDQVVRAEAVSLVEPVAAEVAPADAATESAVTDVAPATAPEATREADPTASQAVRAPALEAAALPVQSALPLEAPAAVSVPAASAPRVEHLLRESVPPQVGALVNGRYRIVGMLETGGLGVLLEAIDTLALGEPRVALKLIEVDWQEEPRAFETLQAIVRHVRRLRHPNVLSILDIDRDQGHAIIALEPLRGRWLSALLREVRGRGVGFAVAWNIISGIANGLAYAHQHGAIHAELNPHMIFLSEDGGVKIAGFGLAHALPMSTERLDVLDGLTLRSYADLYSATNWIHGSTAQGVDDLYPLGVMAYELLTGAHPFRRLSPAAAAGEQLRPHAIPGLDRRIRRVIERCLSFNRQERPVNGANFLAHVQPSEQLLDLVRERFNRSGGDA